MSRPVGGRMAMLFALGLACTALPACSRRAPRLSRGDAAVVVLNPHAADNNGSTEAEPNDTPAQAQPLTLAAPPSRAALSGSIDNAGRGRGGDVDVFRLVVPGSTPANDAAAEPGIRLGLELTPAPGLALGMEFLDEAGRTLESVPGGAGEVTGMPNMSVTPGATYFVRVRMVSPGRALASDAGVPGHSYRLSAALANFEPSEEREPNDRAEQAQELAWYNRTADVVGFAGWRRDEDWYALSAEALEAGWTADLDVEGVDGVALSLTVYDAARQRVAGIRGRKGEKLTLKQVAVPAPPSAGPSAWYVAVRADAGQNRTQHYVLHVQAQLAGAAPGTGGASETEPNDDPSHASALLEGNTTGYLPLGDVDYFTYVPEKPVSLSIEVAPPAQVTPKIEVTRLRDGTALATSAPTKGRVLARVAGVPGEPGEPLLIRLSQGKRDGNASQPYVLKLTAVPRDGAGR